MNPSPIHFFGRLPSCLLLGLCLLLTGCGEFTVPAVFRPPAPLADPVATVDGVVLHQVTADGLSVTIVLQLTNSNDRALPLRSAIYTLKLPGIGEYEGDVHPNATIPAEGGITITLPGSFAFAPGAGAPASIQYELKGKLTYEPPGDVRELLTELGVYLPEFHFQSTGNVIGAQPAQ